MLSALCWQGPSCASSLATVTRTCVTCVAAFLYQHSSAHAVEYPLRPCCAAHHLCRPLLWLGGFLPVPRSHQGGWVGEGGRERVVSEASHNTADMRSDMARAAVLALPASRAAQWSCVHGQSYAQTIACAAQPACRHLRLLVFCLGGGSAAAVTPHCPPVAAAPHCPRPSPLPPLTAPPAAANDVCEAA